MKIGRHASLLNAARLIERNLLIAAQEGDLERMDAMLDMLRALDAIEGTEAPGPREVTSKDVG